MVHGDPPMAEAATTTVALEAVAATTVALAFDPTVLQRELRLQQQL